jgi:predicted DNA-binding transcriptional regulator AlpA
MHAVTADTPAPSPLLSRREAAQRLGLTARFLEKAAQDGTGPRMVKISSRCVRYRPQDLNAWIEGRLTDPKTSA